MNASRNAYGLGFSWLFWGFIMLLFAGILLWGVNWVLTPLDVASPQNMQTLSRQANDRYQSLEAKLSSIQAQERKLNEFATLYGEDVTKWAQGKRQEYQQLSTIVTNLKTSYNGDCAQYMSMWQDEWRSLVAPRDLPTRCELLN